jgi:prolyl oligopeptidase
MTSRSAPDQTVPDTRPDVPDDRDGVIDDIHGHRVPDPYRWLEDPADPRTRRWSQAQDEYYLAERSGWTGVDHFRQRLTELLGAGMISAPIWRGQRQYFMRRTADQEMAVLLTVDPDGTERVLIDPLAIDPSGLTTLDGWQPSKEGDRLAYLLSEGGTEESTLRVVDVVTGELVDGPIDRARYTPVAWLLGGEAFYYVRRLPPELVPPGEEQFHRRVWLHRVGTDPDTDVLIFGEGRKPTEYFGVSVSRDGRWLSISASEGTAPRNDLWLADLQAPGSSTTAPVLTVVQADLDAQTGVEVGRDGRLYVYTDSGSPRGRLCVSTPDRPQADYWRDLLAEDGEAVLDGFAILDGPELARHVLLASWTRHAISEITVHDLASGERISNVPLPGLGTVGGIVERPEGGHEAWFDYTDNTTVAKVLHFDARTGALETWATAPGAVEVPDVATRHVVYRSTDGTDVRMIVLSPPDTDGSEPRPTILYGYGGFGVSLTPGFSANVLAWVEAGGIYAIANLRGGGEEGEDWHRAGMLAHKQNVFDDFHSAAEWLIEEKLTTPESLAISGGSNGGLLVGAAMVQRPDLFTTVVCSAPLLDMVRYEQFGLGATWNVEYGSAADPEQFEWLLSYSPYQQAERPAAYPAVLFTVFDSDTRVDPMHARKMCAALQHSTTSGHPVLLRREADVGHGARSLTRSIELSADTLAFTATWTGLQLQ